MSVFRDYLNTAYAADPAGMSRFVSAAVTLIRVKRRYWRGYRKMQKAEVREDGNELDDTVSTRPSWKLCPKEVLDQFQTMDKQVDDLLGVYCFVPAAEDDDEDAVDASAATILVGGGRYAVDTGVWPRLEKLLGTIQKTWAEAADGWATEEGYARFLELLKLQVGDGTYARVKDLVPDRNKLRARYGLYYRKAPVRFVDDVPADKTGAEDLRGELTDLLDLAVRRPREEAAETWEALAAKLLNPDGTAVRPVRARKGQPPTAGNRALQGKTLAACRDATAALDRAVRYMDATLLCKVSAVRRAIPDTAAEAGVWAKTLNADDTEAIRFGKLLLEAAAAARDETGMCEGLSSAMGPKVR